MDYLRWGKDAGGVPDSYRLKPPRCLLARERGATGVQIHPQPLTIPDRVCPGLVS